MAKKKEAKQPKQKQEEFDEMPTDPIRERILEAWELKEQIGDRQKEYVEIMDDVRKMMRELRKKTLRCETENGISIQINLVSTGEKVTISKVKVKKQDVPDEEPLAE